ncbi:MULTISPECIES: DUF4397 domain-containing protein [Haloarcula]|jgi:hypothetical protein|uniref:DUF4397 domain-containing protein n=1 Tax=Haloarcula TaxID=2237 RepID=UPI000F8F7A55|nr:MULTISPECIES: DUF4397 domain-containing protein [Haloarcula]NHX38556.1 DUF4397 domain-containing protein [Haloarcula sp. R1-2]
MSSDTTRRRILLGIGTGVTVGIAGCSGGGNGGAEEPDTETDSGMDTPMETETDTQTEAETDPGTAAVRVAHMSPNAPNVDVYLEGDAVLEDVPFGAVSQYLDVPAGERSVEITAAGDPDTSVFSGRVPVEADTAYTIAAVGEIGDDADQAFEPLVLEDDNSDPGGDTARVRLVHASPDAPAVDVTLASNGDALYDGVEYGGSGYVEVPSGDYTLQVRGDTESNDGDVAAEFDVSLSGGEVYTAFAAGYLTPDDDPADAPFDLLVTQDTGGSATETETESEPANVRVAHMSPNAPNVDVYVDGSAVLEDVPFGAVSDYLEVPAGARTVEITAAGDPDTSVFEGDVTVEGGQAYTVAAAGEIGDDTGDPFQPLVLADNLTAPSNGTARLRLVHLSPDAPQVDVTVGSSGDVLFDAADFREFDSVEVPAGEYTIQVRGATPDNDGDVVAEYDLSLAGETGYTAFAAGYLTPDDEPADTPFDLIVAQDTGGM